MQIIAIEGYLGQNPELKKAGEQDVVNFTLAETEKFTKKNGTKEEKTTWFNCTAWGALAKIVAEYSKKGSHVLIKGKMESNHYQKDNKDIYGYNFVVNEFKILDKKPKVGTIAPSS